MSAFNLTQAIEILERTPVILNSILNGLSQDWLNANEGENSWTPYDVVGHLIHGEKTDWVVRAKVILSQVEDKTFKPFDRFAQFQNSKGKTLEQLLDEFAQLRLQNVDWLRSQILTPVQLELTGMHPTFGTVTLTQLLATWVVHDLDHLYQIVRVMALRYTADVGPWIKFLKIINQNTPIRV